MIVMILYIKIRGAKKVAFSYLECALCLRQEERRLEVRQLRQTCDKPPSSVF
jgi:hypothetical protein